MNLRSSDENQEIIFFEHNPYMSVELLDLLNNYKIICYNDDYTYRVLKKSWSVESYLNNEFIEEPESDQVAEILLGDQNFLDRVIPDRKHSKVVFFYMNKRMDQLREKTGMAMLLPSFSIQERLGNKIFLSEICDKLGLAKNEVLAFEEIPEDLQGLFIKCKEVLGTPFIVQDALGESGWDTSLVSTEDELRTAKKKIKNGLKAAKYLSNNLPVSVHICVLDDEIIIRGPYLQLIGLSELSATPFRFAGNDTNQSFFNENFIDEVLSMSKKISQFVKDEGYRGIFGIDYLWDKETGVIYPQEINSRIVGLTRLLTGIQKDQVLVPDLVRHLEAFTATSYTDKARILREGNIDLSHHDYAQVIVRNNEPSNVKIFTRLEPGIYKFQNKMLKKTKESLFLHDVEKDEILITSAAHAGCDLHPDEVIVRLIIKESAIDDSEYKLKKEIVELVDVIRRHTISPDR